MYTKTTNTIASVPLVGDVINVSHKLVKTTLGHVDAATQKIGLKKADVGAGGVKTQ